MPELKRRVTKKAKRITRAKGAKKPVRFPAAPKKAAPAREQFQVVQEAHRAQLGGAIAAAAVEELRVVAQIYGLAHDAALRRGEVEPSVLKAMGSADAILTAQIAELERFAKASPPGPVDVADLISRTVTLTRRHFGKGVKVSVDVAEKLPPAKANPLDVTEILFALLANSYQALERKGGRVHISTAFDAKTLRIVVQDNGPGLPPAVKKRLFEPFVKGRQGSTQLGIGLSASRRLALRNSGDLTHDSRHMKGGARFVLAVPRWVSPRTRRPSVR